MNAMARRFSTTIFRSANAISNFRMAKPSPIALSPMQLQSWRGISVEVRFGNLERALAIYGRRMVESGIERIITRQSRHHIKNSEKRILARKNLEQRLRKQDFARKLKSILINKVRGM